MLCQLRVNACIFHLLGFSGSFTAGRWVSVGCAHSSLHESSMALLKDGNTPNRGAVWSVKQFSPLTEDQRCTGFFTSGSASAWFADPASPHNHWILQRRFRLYMQLFFGHAACVSVFPTAYFCSLHWASTNICKALQWTGSEKWSDWKVSCF